MKWEVVEKHGGFWTQPRDDEVLFEHYDPTSDTLGVVLKSRLTYKAIVFKKKSHEPQWKGLWWDEQRPGCLFNTEHDAKSYILSLMAASNEPN